MKILITGNMGYVGTAVVKHLRSAFPDATLVGYDMAYFASSLQGSSAILPESRLDQQIFGDVRNMPAEVLDNVNAVVHLAAIGGDVAEHKYGVVTQDVNYTASIRVAELAKAVGVESFVFASSCSLYGTEEESERTEHSDLKPVSADARTKLAAEIDLEPLAGDGFSVTCLRFPAACGMSDRLRPGLLLNDFVGEALATGNLNIVGNGAAWQPLIHVADLARAVEWAVTREAADGGEYLVVNAGFNDWNFRVYELARAVAYALPGITLNFSGGEVAEEASCPICFDFYQALAPDHQPQYSLQQAIAELCEGYKPIVAQSWHQDSPLQNRAMFLNKLQQLGALDEQLRWAHQKSTVRRESVLEIID
ncbi:NAD-dependent epimerase/dehydratase family protein [Pontibacter beigongshangensis]|uniref:NAD-dependent epimerase/dehydratase family protein n=1 Tax=Pontibacter beigongshangensis TaxID=2574733 RepID=UPI00164FD1C3|nr:SDR family oxidoreductase [Pontibacter beigongshangensis]